MGKARIVEPTGLKIGSFSPGNGGGEGIGVWRGNEPAGYEEITSDDHDNENGEWSYQNGSGTWEIASQPTEPDVDGHGADGVYRTNFPGGMTDGSDAANAFETGLDLPGGDIVGFYWAYTFRLQEGWLNNTNLVKHAFWFWGDHAGGWTGIRSTDGDADGPLHLMLRMKEPTTEWHTFQPSPLSAGQLIRGQWHQVEFQVVGNKSNSNKTIRIWLDGTLIVEAIDYPDATEEGPHQGDYLIQSQYANTYGGGGSDVPQDQYIDVGHTYISGR